MDWSLSDYTAPLNSQEILDQICVRNGLVVALLGNSGRVERNGMVDRSAVDGNGSDVSCKESDFTRNVGVRSDGTHSFFQPATLARKMFAKHYQPGRKSEFTPATLQEKLDSDKCDVSEIRDDEMIQLLD